LPGSLLDLGNVAIARKDYSAASSLLEQGLAIAETVSRPEAARLLCALGWLATELGDTASAMSRYSEALEIGRQLYNKEVVALDLTSRVA
jgi:tetratricopeptide (TPR) repeat protein